MSLNVIDKKPAELVNYKSAQDINKFIGSRCFDIVHCKIGLFDYDIYVDDEGLLKEKPVCSVFNKDGKGVLFGNLVISASDDKGESRDLTIEEIGNLADYFYMFFDLDYGFYTVLFGVNYG